MLIRGTEYRYGGVSVPRIMAGIVIAGRLSPLKNGCLVCLRRYAAHALVWALFVLTAADQRRGDNDHDQHQNRYQYPVFPAERSPVHAFKCTTERTKQTIFAALDPGKFVTR